MTTNTPIPHNIDAEQARTSDSAPSQGGAVSLRELDLITWPIDQDQELNGIIENAVESLRQDYKMGTQGVGRLREQLRQHCLAQMNPLARTPPARR